MKLKCDDRSDEVLSIMKTKKNNDMIDRICVVYTKVKTKLSKQNGLCAVYNKNKTG